MTGRVPLGSRGVPCHGHRLVLLAEVVEALELRPRDQTVVVTGRDARPELIELADTVSEVRKEQHAVEQGIKAQPGVAF